VVLATIGLLMLAPVFALVACAIKYDSRGPVFFRQSRMGGRGQLFRIFKFRTMVVDAEEQKAALAHLNKHAQPGSDPRMFKIPDDPRVTKVGRVLRRYSIDELPQLINVLTGEMSLVGPRPLILEEDRHVDNWARKRMDLKPGMTGLWQVLGRSEIPFEEMVKLDYLYVTTWSLWQDFLLLLRTIPAMAGSSTGSY
jgi:lipopolysaccharide/colanic/teichoic acid biosynthesis glycosyltransferase